MEHVPGKAFRMDTHQWRAKCRIQIAVREDNRFFGFSRADSGKPVNAKLAEACRKIGLGNLVEL